MSKSLKHCGSLSGKQVESLSAYVNFKVIQNGNYDLDAVMKSFWQALAKREPNSRALLTGYLPVIISGHLVAKLNTPDAIKKSDRSLLTKMLTEAIDLAENFREAENIFDYIESTIVAPLTDSIETEEDSDVQEEQGEDLEEENQPDPKTEEELKKKLDLIEESLLDDEQENEFEYKVSEYLAVTNALIHRKGLTIYKGGEKREVKYRKGKKGEDMAVMYIDGIESNVFELNEFIRKYGQWDFVADEPQNTSDTDRKNATSSQFEKTIEWLGQKLSLAYGNAIDKATSLKNYFSINEKGKLEAGDITEVFKQKNEYFSSLLQAGENARLMDGLHENERATASFSLQLSDYEHVKAIGKQKRPYLNVVVNFVRNGERKSIIVANIAPPTDGSELIKTKGETDQVRAYRENYIKLLNQVMASPTQKIELAKNTPVKKVFLPVLDSRNAHNAIYQNEKERAESDLDKAQTLNLRNAVTLMRSMGYGISPVMIDVQNKSESAMAGQAFIATSPFHTDLEIKKILSDNKVWADAGSLHHLAVKHNINILYLKRKELKFEDYSMVLNGNINPGRYVEKDGTVKTEHRKISALFNPSQSYYLLRRIAVALESIEKAIENTGDATKKAKLQDEFERMVVFFFNNLHSHGIPINNGSMDLNILNSNVGISQDLSAAKQGEAVPSALKTASMEAWKNYKSASATIQNDQIKQIAIRRFGYFGNGNDSLSNDIRQQKIDSLRFVKESDGKTKFSDANYLSEGGMTGSEVVKLFDWLRENPALQKAAATAFDAPTLRDTEQAFPTFNPVVQGKRQPNQNIVEAHPIAPGTNSGNEETDLNFSFLETDLVPMMPHMVVGLESIMQSGKVGMVSQPTAFSEGEGLNKILEASKSKKPGFGSRRRLAEKLFSKAKGREKQLTEQEAIALTESLIGGLAKELEFGKAPIKLKESIAIGEVSKGLFWLHSQNGRVKETVLRHEIFHKVLNEIVDQESYDQIMKEGRELMAKEYNDRDFTSLDVEEYLAERYELSHGTHGNRFIAKLPGWLQTLFRGMRTLYRMVSGNPSAYNALLENLEEGAYRLSTAQFDNYNGDSRYKEFNTTIHEISMKLGWGESTDEILVNGREEFDFALTDIRNGVLETIYQNEELFVSNDMKNLTIKGGAELDFKLRVQKILTEGMPVYFPEISNPTVEEAFEAVNRLDFQELNENKDLLNFRNYVKATELFESLKEYAFDFYDFNKGNDYEFDVETDEELLAQLDPDAETDSKMSQLADRGALSGMKTMNKKVKFHLASTMLQGESEPINAEKAANILVEISNKTPFKNGKFDTNTFIGLLHDRVKNLSLAKESMEYKTMKAVWDKYFNPSNPDSFMVIGNKVSDNPKLTGYYKRHMDVLTALISGYSTVKVTEYAKPVVGYDSVSINPTNSSKGSEVKNEYNSNYLNNNFGRTVVGDQVHYVMNAETISRLFNPNDSFALSFEKDAISIKVNGKDLRIPRAEFKASQSNNYVDLNRKFVQDLLKNGEFDYMDFHPLFKAMGFNISEEVALDYLRYKSADKFERSQIDTNRVEFVQNAVLSYLIMAAEMVNQKEINENATPEMMAGFTEFGGEKFLKEVANQRIDSAANITNEETRGSAEQEVTREMYTPTKFSEFFKKVGQIQTTFRIGSASSFEIIGGTKHNKDKINTPLMERLSALKDVAVEAQKTAKSKGLDPKQYIAENFPNLGSAFYQNKFMTGEQEFSAYFQLQTLESRDNNAVKSFLDFNDIEFHRLLLSGLLSGKDASNGSKFDSDEYWHPTDVQADRGYLPLILLKKLFVTGYNENGLALTNNERLIPELSNVYGHRFNVARVMLEQIKNADVNGVIKVTHPNPKSGLKNIPLKVALSWNIEPELIKNYFGQVNAQLDGWLSQDETARRTLPQNGVWQKIGGKYQLNRLIESQINVDFDSFLTEEMRKFKRFAEKTFAHFNTGNNMLKTDIADSKVYKEPNKKFLSVYENEDGSPGESKKPTLFRFKEIREARQFNVQIQEQIDSLTEAVRQGSLTRVEAKSRISELEKSKKSTDILQHTHPAVMDMYFNYRVNNLMVRQMVFGEMHSFNPAKGMENLEAGYMPEYSKRMSGAGTSKINFVFRESIQVKDEDGNLIQMALSPDGLDSKIEVLNLENIQYTVNNNPDFLRNIMENRTNIKELVAKQLELQAQLESAQDPESLAQIGKEMSELQAEIQSIQEEFGSRNFATDDGLIYASQLMMSLARNSMGNTEGFPIKALMKLTLNSVDQATGNVDYDKALNMVLSPEYMDEVGLTEEIYLKAMYAKGVISGETGTQTLWDIYEMEVEKSGSRTLAERKVLKAFLEARENGTLVSQPAMYVNTRSSTKSTLKKINPNPVDMKIDPFDSDDYMSSLVYDTRDLSTGFGAVLDLTSDINDKDIALSSQMLYLLGIVGDKNHFSVQKTYQALEKMSNYNAQDIKREVEKTKEKYGIEDETEMVRAWALDIIRKSYENQGDFGSGYRLSEDPITQAISHPLHKNKMFGAISARINKGIGLRVKGFKGIQLPATNMLFLYETPSGVMTLSQAKKMFGGELVRMMESGEIVKRNLKYASAENGKITQTEIISGNFFTKRFKTGNKTIREIFNLQVGDTLADLEAEDYQDLQDQKDKDGKTFNPYKKRLQKAFKDNFKLINWTENVGLKNAIATAEKEMKSLKKKKERLAVSEEKSDIEKANLLSSQIEILGKTLGAMTMLQGGMAVELKDTALAFAKVADAYHEMNKALYGIMTRIPSTGKNSSTVFRVRAFVNSHENGMFVPAEWLEITGSDHDGDSAMMWQFGSKSPTAEEMLDATISILSDVENASEIFSDVDTDMNFVKQFAKQKNTEAAAKGFGYNSDDLYTFNEIRGNNAVGSTMTGSSALVAKTYSYAYITKMQYLSLGGNLEAFKAPDILIEGENPSLNILDKFRGLIPERASDGNFVYKWLETITNSAIDNPKHLTMGALGIKRYNSDLHAAMVFMGFSKNTIANFFNHPVAKEVFAKAESYNDVGANFYSVTPLTAAINYLMSQHDLEESPQGDEGRPSSFFKKDFDESLQTVSDKNAQALYDRDYLLNLLNVLNYYAEDFKTLQNVTKVSDQIKGTPQEQRNQFDKILSGLDFTTYAQLKNFVNEYRNTRGDKAKIMKMSQLQKASSNRLLNPRLILALNPNLMASLKGHMEFIEKTNAHLLHSEEMVRLKKKLERMIPKKLLSRAFYKNKIDQAFYNQFGAMFLEGVGHTNSVTTQIEDKQFDFKNLEDRMAFIHAFKEKIFKMKKDPAYRNNAFLDDLTFDGNLPEIKMSHNFDMAQENIMLNAFRKMDKDLKDQFFYFLLITDGLVFKKHGIMKFISPETYQGYNSFLKQLEQGKESIWNSKNMNAFVHNFFIANKDMAPEFKVKDVAESEFSLAYFPGNASYEKAGNKSLKRKETFERRTINASGDLKEMASQTFGFNEKFEKDVKAAQADLKAVRKEINQLTGGLNNAVDLLFPPDVAETAETGNTIKNSLLNKSGTFELEEKEDWSRKEKNAFKKIMGFSEAYEPALKQEIGLSEKLETSENNRFRDSIDEMIESGNVKNNNRSPYRMAKYFDNGKVYSALYQLAVVRQENAETGKTTEKLVWQKVKTYSAMLDMPINAFQTGKITPTLLQSETMKAIDYSQYQILKRGEGATIPHLNELMNSKTNFFTQIDENGQMTSFQLTEGLEKAESIQKLKAIADVVQRAFPGIKIKFVKNQSGIYAKAKGWVNQGVIHINLDTATSDTALHEAGHILIDMIEQTDKTMFEKLVKMAKMHPAFDQISQRYQVVKNTEMDNVKETLVTLLGKSQAELLEEAAEENQFYIQKMVNGIWIQFKSAIRKAMESLGVKINSDYETLLDQLDQSSNLESIFHLIGKAVIEGKVMTDLSSRQFAKLEMKHGKSPKTKFSKAEINQKIKELIEQGIVTRTCLN